LIWVRDSRQVEVERDPQAQVTHITVYGVVSDITERKLAETELENERARLAQRVEARTADLKAANDELANAIRLKDEFLANMSHELRTPLNAILGRTEMLLEGIHGNLSDKQGKSLLTIEESARHLLDLISDILDMSKIEAGMLELELGWVSPEEVCQACLRLIKEAAHKKNLKVISTFDIMVNKLRADERRWSKDRPSDRRSALNITYAAAPILCDASPKPCLFYLAAGHTASRGRFSIQESTAYRRPARCVAEFVLCLTVTAKVSR
jgi:signal transduction histidine kinase